MVIPFEGCEQDNGVFYGFVAARDRARGLLTGIQKPVRHGEAYGQAHVGISSDVIVAGTPRR